MRLILVELQHHVGGELIRGVFRLTENRDIQNIEECMTELVRYRVNILSNDGISRS